MSPTGPTLETLEAGAELVGRGPAGERPLVLMERTGAPPHIVLWFAGIETRDQAAALSGLALMSASGALPALEDESTYYVRDLIGCAVVVGGRVVGTVTDVVSGAANDVVEVDSGGTRTLIPFVGEAVVSLDLGTRRIEVRDGFLHPGE